MADGAGAPGEVGPAPPRRRPAWLPRPFELYTWAVFTLAVLFLRNRGLRVDGRTFQYTFGPFLGAAPKFLALGVLLQLAYQTLVAAGGSRREAAISYLRTIATPAWLWLWLRMFVAYALFNYVYFWVKVCVPLLNPRLWDPALWRLDRSIHLGLSPSVLAVELCAHTPLAGWLDRWYGIWILTVMAAVVFFTAGPRADHRRSFLLACAMLWTTGAGLYLALPALGPAYTDPEVFAPVAADTPRAVAGQAALRENYQRMVAGRSGPLTRFNPTRGVAAMPSLHVGGHVLFLLWAWRFARPLRVPFLVATVLTFAGSLVTGWHYAVDGYVGALLACGVFLLATRLEPVEPTGSARPAERPGAARPAAG